MTEPRRTDAIAGEIVHEYDGIEEADNALPVWWVAVFIITVVFAATYWLMVQAFHMAPTPAEALALAEAERAQRTGVVSESELQSAAQSASQVSAGKLAFTTNCIACHGSKGEGNIGPNLTDEQWLHGGGAAQIFATIRDGVPAKGMPTWGPLLGPAAVKSLTAYVLSVRNTHIPGKAPQGEPYIGI
jgi:cytochrome c oxidase cbb3-type subunit 3